MGMHGQLLKLFSPCSPCLSPLKYSPSLPTLQPKNESIAIVGAAKSASLSSQSCMAIYSSSVFTLTQEHIRLTNIFPGFPFPSMTPSSEYVLAHHKNYSKYLGCDNVYVSIQLSCTEGSMAKAQIRGMCKIHTHHLEGSLRVSAETQHLDHLIVASGNNNPPAVPDYPGS